MIISTWLVYLLARKGIGGRSAGDPDSAADGGEKVSLMDQWRRKLQGRTCRLFRCMTECPVAQRAESVSAPPAFMATSEPEPQQDNMSLSGQTLHRSLSQPYLESTTTIKILKQSQTRVRMVKMPTDEAAQEGLEQMQNCMSHLVHQAELDHEEDADVSAPLLRNT